MTWDSIGIVVLVLAIVIFMRRNGLMDGFDSTKTRHDHDDDMFDTPRSSAFRRPSSTSSRRSSSGRSSARASGRSAGKKK